MIHLTLARESAAKRAQMSQDGEEESDYWGGVRA